MLSAFFFYYLKKIEERILVACNKPITHLLRTETRFEQPLRDWLRSCVNISIQSRNIRLFSPFETVFDLSKGRVRDSELIHLNIRKINHSGRKLFNA